jgi:chemotaxis family two-component system response regulator Rcp1
MSKPLQVLLVEDNPGDADLTRESLESSPFAVELTVAINGAQAIEFVHRQGKFTSAPRPDLILLDMNLPGFDGRVVLADIKRDPELKRIPVCMLTSSKSEKDVGDSYDLGANCYVVKPLGFKTFQEIVLTVQSFWFTTVKLPQQTAE